MKEEYLADIKAEVVMNDIHKELVFNSDQTGMQLVPTGEWAMHEAKAKVVPITNSDDKRQMLDKDSPALAIFDCFKGQPTEVI